MANSPQVHAFFSDLLKTYAEKFAKIHSAKQSKELNTYQLPLKFAGLYSNPQTGNGYGKMGLCSLEEVIYPIKQKVVNISLNRLYLLNKFGHDKYFTSNPEISGDYSYLDISFSKMLETCSHELAHYLQFVKWGRSSCESDLVLGNGKYSEELAQEHKEWTQEIYQMVKEDFLQLEQKWKET